MNETTNLMDFNALAMTQSAEFGQIARIRERQRRERKVALYSYSKKKHKDSK